jgi:hypothetical protein
MMKYGEPRTPSYSAVQFLKPAPNKSSGRVKSEVGLVNDRQFSD